MTTSKRSRWIVPLVAIIAALATGAASGLLVVLKGEQIGQSSHDHWLGNRGVGSTRADPWTRAIIARIGLLALNRSETIYFTRYRDSEGRAFRADCAYEISGTDLPARWWSVTLYGADDFLPPNDDGAFSIDATRTLRDASGRWRARISTNRDGAQNWISSRAADSFDLSLRLYNPTPGALADETMIPFPTVTRLSCEGDER